MKYLYAGLIILSAGLLQGCTYPDAAKIEQKDSRPAIGVSGAPEGAALYVDGLKMGMASQFDGEENVLLIESGKHLIEVQAADGKVLLSETLFLSSSTTKILTIQP
ncbi:MAG: hypothetical protein DRP64_12435 [Verrucomicrobia bacterium]|nr:MAG: hypothetical protein DRP64_12435 [Verrucomicrobiota bacterium]